MCSAQPSTTRLRISLAYTSPSAWCSAQSSTPRLLMHAPYLHDEPRRDETFSNAVERHCGRWHHCCFVEEGVESCCCLNANGFHRLCVVCVRASAHVCCVRSCECARECAASRAQHLPHSLYVCAYLRVCVRTHVCTPVCVHGVIDTVQPISPVWREQSRCPLQSSPAPGWSATRHTHSIIHRGRLHAVAKVHDVSVRDGQMMCKQKQRTVTRVSAAHHIRQTDDAHAKEWTRE
jgi:hypothetical protein